MLSAYAALDVDIRLRTLRIGAIVVRPFADGRMSVPDLCDYLGKFLTYSLPIVRFILVVLLYFAKDGLQLMPVGLELLMLALRYNHVFEVWMSSCGCHVLNYVFVVAGMGLTGFGGGRRRCGDFVIDGGNEVVERMSGTRHGAFELSSGFLMVVFPGKFCYVGAECAQVM